MRAPLTMMNREIANNRLSVTSLPEAKIYEAIGPVVDAGQPAAAIAGRAIRMAQSFSVTRKAMILARSWGSRPEIVLLVPGRN